MKKAISFTTCRRNSLHSIPPSRATVRDSWCSNKNGRRQARYFHNIAQYIEPGDCLILNDTKVLPARLYGTRVDTGSVVEFLLLNNKGDDIWEVITGPGKRHARVIGSPSMICSLPRLLTFCRTATALLSSHMTAYSLSYSIR